MLAERGAQALILLDLDAARLGEAAEECAALGAVAQAGTVDCGDFPAVAAIIPELEQSTGPVDLLVNAAGNVTASTFLRGMTVPSAGPCTDARHTTSVELRPATTKS